MTRAGLKIPPGRSNPFACLKHGGHSLKASSRPRVTVRASGFLRKWLVHPACEQREGRAPPPEALELAIFLLRNTVSFASIHHFAADITFAGTKGHWLVSENYYSDDEMLGNRAKH